VAEQKSHAHVLFRHEEALRALELAMRVSPTIAEDWQAWQTKESLLHSLQRQDEADAAHTAYRDLLEIAAGALPTEGNATFLPAQRQLLVEKIHHNEGTLDEQEHWLKMIERWEIDIDVYEMEALIRAVTARRLVARLHDNLGSPLTREQLVILVQRLMNAQGTEEEQDAWLKLIAEETGASQGSITDDIYWPKQEMTAEQIVERAIARGKRT
jgi:hypothetical protein